MPDPPKPRPPSQSDHVYRCQDAESTTNRVADLECLFCGGSPPKHILIKACGLWEAPYMISDEADRQEAWVAHGWACFSCLRDHGEWEEDPGA